MRLVILAGLPPDMAELRAFVLSGYHIPSDLEWSQYEYCLDATLAPVDTNSATNTLSYFQTASLAWLYHCGCRTGYKMKGGGTAMWGTGDNGTNTSGFMRCLGVHASMARSAIWVRTPTTGRLRSTMPRTRGIGSWARAAPGGRDWSLLRRVGYSVRCLQD